MVRIDRGLVDKNIYASQEELYWIEEYGGGGREEQKWKKKTKRTTTTNKGKNSAEKHTRKSLHVIEENVKKWVALSMGYWPQCLTIAVINYLQADKFESFSLRVYIHDS